jgi:hypothetical protein
MCSHIIRLGAVRYCIRAQVNRIRKVRASPWGTIRGKNARGGHERLRMPVNVQPWRYWKPEIVRKHLEVYSFGRC